MKMKQSEEPLRKIYPVQNAAVLTEVPQQREPKPQQTLQPAKVIPVSVSEELKAKPPVEATNKYYTQTQEHTDTRTHIEWRGSVCSARSCLRSGSSVVVSYCSCPERYQ